MKSVVLRRAALKVEYADLCKCATEHPYTKKLEVHSNSSKKLKLNLESPVLLPTGTVLSPSKPQ